MSIWHAAATRHSRVTSGFARLKGGYPTSGPFDKTGGVKQGYLWPLKEHFVESLLNDHGESLRGTSLHPGNTWLFASMKP